MGRRLPVGAETFHEGAHFRVWAPRCASIELAIESGARVALEPEAGGWWSGVMRDVGAGARYRFRLDDDPALYPDPASRSQPEGPHGPSELVDPGRFEWSDAAWRGRALRDAVIYELHVGTFTPEGTWAAAAERLPDLAQTGITVVEMMPVAEFAGRFGWGYDGVALFAPYHGYGAPDDLRRFVDRAHALGIAVLLDVVYNHLGPDGNYLRRFAPEAFTDRYRTDWGEPLNFDGEGSGPVRAFFRANVRHWIEEYHLDGLRIDATQDIYDQSDGPHILSELTQEARDAAGARTVLVIGENEPQSTRVLEAPAMGGYGFDAIWNDDFHHSAAVALTGRNEAYFCDYRGSSQELASAAKHGFLYQGQRYAWQSKRRGSPTLGIDRSAFIQYLENHDQVANSYDGRRLYSCTSPSKHRALVALSLLGSATPMLFQGEEFLSSAPFLYFADHHAELAPLVREGRADFLQQFSSIARSDVRDRLHDPADPEAFRRCKLDHGERDRPGHAAHLAMVRALLAMRRGDPVINGASRRGIDAAVLDASCSAGALPNGPTFLVRYLSESPSSDRLLVINLGGSGHFTSIAEPLFAPPPGMRWAHLFASEDAAWGGRGGEPVEQDDGIHLTAECTVVLAPEPEPRGGERDEKTANDEPRVARLEQR